MVCRSEKDIFAALGLQYIEPELRENMGEIQAAEKEQLPVLIERRDVHGFISTPTSVMARTRWKT